jgi:class 3 adenylate cyclase/predicted ATPase
MSADTSVTLPSGTVTFLFTDVEGSTRLWDAFPDDMREALRAHDEVITAAAIRRGGVVVKHTGDGLFVAFDSATEATQAAVAAQRGLADVEWPDVVGSLMVRMALHTAEVSPTGNDYLSPDVNRVARIEAAGHGGQILLSGSTSRLVGGALPDGTALLDLGTHPLRGLSDPEHIHQLAVEGLHATFPPLRTEAALVGQLPTFGTEFVGRQDELDDLVALALEAGTRVLSVVANGGMGKTRIAVEAARRIAEQSGAVAHFVSLESVTDEHAITSTVASSVGFGIDLHLSGAFSEQRQLFDFLSAHRLVLVLDNLEQIAGAGTWVSALVAAVPSVTVLATSRDRLRVTAERVFPLAGMDAADDAVALFCSRCAAAGAPIRPDSEGVATLVELLDGMPLALELAAAWAPMLPVTEIVSEIRRDLDFLTSTNADTNDRHRSVRAVFEQSWRRLEADVRSGLSRLGVFVAPFTREAAAAVADVGLPTLMQLVQSSLLRRDPLDDTFSLHPLLREFAADRLEAREALEERYARHYLAELVRRADDLEGARQIEARDELVEDLGHLRAALHWAITRLGDDELVELVAVANRFYFLHSWVESITDFGRLVAASRAATPVAPTAHLLLRAFWMLMRTQFEPSDDLEEGFRTLVEDAEALGELPLRVARAGFGILEAERSNYQESVKWLELAESTQAEPNTILDLQIGAWKGWALLQLGRPEEGRTVFTGYLAGATERRDGISRAFLLSKLGVAEDDLGDHASAAERHHEGREIFVKAGDEGGQGYTLSRLSWTHYLMGNYELALRYALDGLSHFETMNLRWGIAVSHSRAGLAELAMGRTTEAKPRFLETIRLAREAGLPDQVHYGIIGVGLALAAEQRPRDGAFLLLGSLAAERNPYKDFAERGMDDIRSTGSVEDLDSVGTAAVTLTLDELADEAVRLATSTVGG